MKLAAAQLFGPTCNMTLLSFHTCSYRALTSSDRASKMHGNIAKRAADMCAAVAEPVLPYLQRTSDISGMFGKEHQISQEVMRQHSFMQAPGSEHSPYCLLCHDTEVEHLPVPICTIYTVGISSAAPPQS